MSGRRQPALAIFVVAALFAATAGPALAGGPTAQSPFGENLVRGAAPLPEFHLNFLLEDTLRSGAGAAEAENNLEISLTSPDNGVLRFLFSPRPQLGLSFDKATGANRAYAGLTWNVFDTDTVFGNIGVAGTYAGATPDRRTSLPPLMLHGALELGYHVSGEHSFSLSLDHARSPDPTNEHGETIDHLRLRYGLKF